MSGFELNKIAGAILLVGILMMVTGKIGGALYHPVEAKTRGYSVDTASLESGDAGAAGAAAAAPIDIAALMATASAEQGEIVAKKCMACHGFDNGGANKVGPNLYGIVDNPIGKHAGFAYSAAMASHGGNWDQQSLAQFINNPKKFVKGTKMSFAGLSKPEDIANVIAYMKKNGN